MSAHAQDPRPSHYDVVIVGAGIAGCSTARALARANPSRKRKILLVDAHREHNRQFAGEFLHPRGAQVLRDLGLYRDLVKRGAVRMAGFLVQEGPEADPVRLSYATLEQGSGMGLGIDHLTLNQSLREQLTSDPAIELRLGWRATALCRGAQGELTGLELRSSDRRNKERVSCDAVIAADGKRSTVRRLAEIPDGPQALGFTVGLSFAAPDLPEPEYARVILGGPGPMLLYAIEHREPRSFRYRLTIDVPRGLPAKGGQLGDYLRLHYFPYLPDAIARACQASLDAGTPLDLAPAVHLPANDTRVPGLALIGDAAGCSHPITASGMTMALLDAETLGRVAKTRADAQGPWLNAEAMQGFYTDHDRYVPTRQAVASAIAEAFRGENEGARCIRRALFSYWRADPKNAQRSLALLSCVEARPQIFLTEYLKAARHALAASLFPEHATALPLADRWWKLRGTMRAAQEKFALVADVGWRQVRPAWWTQQPTAGWQRRLQAWTGR